MRWAVLALLLAACGGDDACGALGQKCCSGHQCSSSDLGCFYTAANTVGTCMKCGQPTAPCCADAPQCMGMDVQCRGTDPPVCVSLGPCGQQHLRCCDMVPLCGSGLTCQANPGGMPTPWCN
jgi:hypothetical protein